MISSAKHEKQLSELYFLIDETRIINWIPRQLVKPPQFMLGYLFRTQNKKLIKEIVDDTKPEFIRWTLSQIVKWKSQPNSLEPIRIHGTHDRLIPLKGDAIKIKGGGHFMTVDRAQEISNLVIQRVRNAG